MLAILAGLATLATVSLQGTQAGTATPLPAVTNADGRLGLCDVLPGTAPSGVSWAQLASAAGASVNRWEFRWDRVESQRGSWDFSADDAAVAASLGAGLEVQGILIGTPGWAAAHGQKPGNGVPRGLYLAPSDTHNLWAEYVRAMVTHYRGQVRLWEIWNEPDLAFFWSGTPADYLRLMTVADQVIETVDPGATVLMGGMVDPGLSFVRNVLSGVHGDAPFNAAAWHAYGPARSVYTNVGNLRSLLAQHGLGSLPIWVNEAGFPASNPNGEQRQAAFVLQTVAYAFAAGAARVLIYRASDDVLPKTYGLVAASGVPRMGYVAFQVAASQLAHVQAMTYLAGANVERFTFYEGNRLVTMLWNRGAADTRVQLTASGPTAQVTDWQGNLQTVNAAGGAVQLTLPGASYNTGVDAANSVVGGPPALVVQDNTTPPGLSLAGYVSPVRGHNRRLALLNHGTAPLTVRVNAASNPRMHQVLTIQPGALQTVDLDLFAGPSYAGAYTLSSSAPLVGAAGSSQVSVPASTAARAWFVAAADGSVSITNPGAAAVKVAVASYSGTKQKFSGSVVVTAGKTLVWKPPAKLSSVFRAPAPIVVTGSGAAAGLNPSWYAVQPPASHVSLFNPQKSSANVDVRFVGSDTVTGQQLHLSPHRTYSLNTHDATALVISADRKIAAGYRTAAGTAQIASQPGTDSVIASTGPQTHVALFNPSTTPAHVAYTVLARGSSTAKSLVVAPGSVATLQARTSADAPRGVVIQSDVPVVAQPAG